MRTIRPLLFILMLAGCVLCATACERMIPLSDAMQSLDPMAVQTALNQGSNPNQINETGAPFLVVAAREAQPEILAMLLGAGAEPDAVAPDEETALVAAVKQNDAASIEALAAYGADVNRETATVRPLGAAARLGNYSAAEALITAGAGIPRRFSRTHPLCLAAESGHVGIAKLLLSHGADPKHACVAIAARKGHLDYIREMVAAGASPDLTIGDEDAALVAAARRGDGDQIDFLLAIGADPNVPARLFPDIDLWGTPLHVAAWRGDIDSIDALIDAGANPNSAGKSGVFPLSTAADVDTAQKLITGGAVARYFSPETDSAVDRDAGREPMHSIFSAEVADFLVRGHGAVIDTLSAVQQASPLLLALRDYYTRFADNEDLRQRRLAVAQYLIGEHADLLAVAADGHSPLGVIFDHADEAMIDFLKQKRREGWLHFGADPLGRTGPLHLCAKSGDLENVKTLVQLGVDMNRADWHGYNVLGYAEAEGHKDVAEFLRASGAIPVTRERICGVVAASNLIRLTRLLALTPNFNPVYCQGRTLLGEAVDRDNQALVRLLLELGADPNHLAASAETADNPQENPFALMVEKGAETGLIRLAVNRGADISHLGWGTDATLLHMAAKSGQVDTVRFFIELGLPVNAKTSDDKTPMDYAVANAVRQELALHGGRSGADLQSESIE
ncbi:MAG: ankyrin repeat domain-containing protein [Candidatus Lernaella stagnicola]|nr:ankyrin repeat domain-containing protein [Candidatus Lernaella stagnicola]